jgi:hypothetical protein
MQTLDYLSKPDIRLAKFHRVTLFAATMATTSIVTLGLYVGAGLVELLPHRPVLSGMPKFYVLCIAGIAGIVASIFAMTGMRCCARIPYGNLETAERYKLRAIGALALAALPTILAFVFLAEPYLAFMVTLGRRVFQYRFHL